MALNAQEQAALRAIIASEGGTDAAVDLVRGLAIEDKRAAATAALGSAVSFAVSNWQIPAQHIAQAKGDMLPSVIADISAAWTTRDQGKLGALFVQLFAASKAHFGL